MAFEDIFSKKKTVNEERAKIIADNREKSSLLIIELMKLKFDIAFEQLAVADYLVNGVAIERKTISDLKSSIINKRIFSQLLELQQYEKKILLIEGYEKSDIYAPPLHENAVRGFILSASFDYKIPVVFTKDERDSARYILQISKEKKKVENSLRYSKILLSDDDRIQFILEGFPGIGPSSAKKLIGRFGSLNKIFNASKEELEEVIGKKSEIFYMLLNKIYPLG